MAKSIKNQYKKLPGFSDLWNAWDLSQRSHFINDHIDKFQEIEKSIKPKKENKFHAEKIGEYLNSIYIELPDAIKTAIVMHKDAGQYEKGGPLSGKIRIIEDKVTTIEDEPERIIHEVAGIYKDYYFTAKTNNSYLHGYGSDGINKGSIQELEIFKLTFDPAKVTSAINLADYPEFDNTKLITYFTDGKFKVKKPASGENKEVYEAITKHLQSLAKSPTSQETKFETGGPLPENLYVVVSEKDDVWVILSTPVDKDIAEKFKEENPDMALSGETLKVVTLQQANDHTNVIGRDYLTKFETGGPLFVGHEQTHGDNTYKIEKSGDTLVLYKNGEKIAENRDIYILRGVMKSDISNFEMNDSLISTHVAYDSVSLESVGSRHYLRINGESWQLTDAQLTELLKELESVNQNPLSAANYLVSIDKSEYEKVTKHESGGQFTKEAGNIARGTMQTADGEIEGYVRWNPLFNKYQTYIDGVPYEEFNTPEEAIDHLERAGIKNIQKFETGGSLPSVGGFNLIYETWSTIHGGDGVSGTIRVSPQNYYVATVNSDKSLTFDGLESITRDIDQHAVCKLWLNNEIPLKTKRFEEGGPMETNIETLQTFLQGLNLQPLPAAARDTVAAMLQDPVTAKLPITNAKAQKLVTALKDKYPTAFEQPYTRADVESAIMGYQILADAGDESAANKIIGLQMLLDDMPADVFEEGGATSNKVSVRKVIDGKDVTTDYDTYELAKEVYDNLVHEHDLLDDGEYATSENNEDNWVEIFRTNNKFAKGGPLKIASSPTIEGLEKLLNEYYYSTTFKIHDDLSVHNSKGLVPSVEVINKNGRYIAGHPMKFEKGGFVPQLELNRKYKTDSMLGGVFIVEYSGVDKDGNHVFINQSPDFKGQEYTVKPEDLNAFIIPESKFEKVGSTNKTHKKKKSTKPKSTFKKSK